MPEWGRDRRCGGGAGVRGEGVGVEEWGDEGGEGVGG